MDERLSFEGIERAILEGLVGVALRTRHEDLWVGHV
jgi:hypothetical protein